VKIFFNQLFDYNFFCNKKLIETCSSIDVLPEKSIWLFSHILNTHHRWNAKLLNKEVTYELFQIHEIRDWGDIHYENQRSSFEITSNVDDFERRIDYENDEGRLFTNTVQDILFHIINHSTHHRGQIATDFRLNELEPIPLDYVLYKR